MKVLFIALALVPIGFGQNGIPMSTEKGKITLFVEKIYQDSIAWMKLPTSILEGSIRNDTQFKLEFVRFEVVAYSDDGLDLKICDQSNLGLRCEFHVFQSVGPGETVRLDRLGGTFHPNRPVPKGQRIARLEYRVIEAPYYIKYDIRSTPVTNEKFTIIPTFDLRGIDLDFRSTSSDVIEILWDQSVYIDEDANASRLIRGNVRLMEKDRPQPNTVIPPGTKLKETVFPVDHVKQKQDGSLYQAPLFPEIVMNNSQTQSVGSLTGKEVRLFLRLLVNDQKQSITIPFKIVRVEY